MEKQSAAREEPRMVTKLGELAQLLVKSNQHGLIVLITGLPGAGKDFIARKIMKNRKPWVFLDEYGVDSKGKWITKVPPEDLSGASVIVGVSDNLVSVVTDAIKARATTKWPVKGLLVVHILPDYEVFVRANAAKALAETPFKKQFEANSKMSRSAVQKLAERKADFLDVKLREVTSSHALAFETTWVQNQVFGNSSEAVPGGRERASVVRVARGEDADKGGTKPVPSKAKEVSND